MKRRILFVFLAVVMMTAEGCAGKETGKSPVAAEGIGEAGQETEAEQEGAAEEEGKDGETGAEPVKDGASAEDSGKTDKTAPSGAVQETGQVLEDASGSLTEEEKLLNERMEYYRKSAYYPEIVDYWENVREVRDVANRTEQLYESDMRYLSREELSGDPPVVIHLAKNEIYARHGYIFKDQDLYNYFMGCIWYTPSTAPEDFSDTVFNSYEKENLKLLGELDTLTGTAGNKQAATAGNKEATAKAVFDSVLQKLCKDHTLPDGTDLGYDEVSDLSKNQFAVYDIDQDGEEELIIVWITTITAGMTEVIYGFDSASGVVREELWEYPMLTFYDNGVVEAGASHNHGLAGDMDFWPYTLYRYDKNADAYTMAAGVDAWNKKFYEKDFNDQPFPDDIDADGDGVVYIVTTADGEKLMDLEDYKNWRDSFVGGAKKVEIPFQKMS